MYKLSMDTYASAFVGALFISCICLTLHATLFMVCHLPSTCCDAKTFCLTLHQNIVYANLVTLSCSNMYSLGSSFPVVNIKLSNGHFMIAM
jgi:hypothetical protein